VAAEQLAQPGERATWMGMAVVVSAVGVVMLVSSMVVRVVVGMAREPCGSVGLFVLTVRVAMGMIVAIIVRVLVALGSSRVVRMLVAVGMVFSSVVRVRQTSLTGLATLQ
jgi:hypothetical protein